jgi:hypothetical protein
MSSPNTYLPSKILVATNKYHNHQPLMTLISSKEKKNLGLALSPKIY